MTEFTELERFPGDDDEAADLQVLAQLEKHGADLSKETEFVHYLYFDGEDRARAAAEQLADVGYAAKGRPSDESYLVVAERLAVPSMDNVRRMRQFMQTLAAQFSGEYDGWEAAVTK